MAPPWSAAWTTCWRRSVGWPPAPSAGPVCAAVATPAARAVLQALGDGQVLGLTRLATATGLAPPAVGSALLELELAGLVRRSAAGAEALAVFPRPHGA